MSFENRQNIDNVSNDFSIVFDKINLELVLAKAEGLKSGVKVLKMLAGFSQNWKQFASNFKSYTGIRMD